MTDKIVDLHFGPKKDVQSHDEFITRAYGNLIRNIEAEGLSVMITRGADHFDFEQGHVGEIWTPHATHEGIRTVRQLGGIGLNEIGVIRDFGQKIVPKMPYDVPLINAPATRRYNDSKDLSYREVLRDFQAPIVGLGSLDNLDMLYGDRIVVKPDNGSGGKGVEMTTKNQVQSIMERASETTYIAQEFIDMTAKFPAPIRGMDSDEQAMIDRLSARPKELRMFCFHGKEGTQTVPIARFMKEADESSDTWVYVDPEKIPDELHDIASTVFDTLSRRTGVSEIYGATDFIWGSTAREPDRRWMVGEVNLWRPAVSRRKPEIARIHDDQLAAQLARIARSEV